MDLGKDFAFFRGIMRVFELCLGSVCTLKRSLYLEKKNKRLEEAGEDLLPQSGGDCGSLWTVVLVAEVKRGSKAWQWI